MPLTVENGFYPDGANSYVSLEDADAYLVPRELWPETPPKPENEAEETEKPDGNVKPSAPEIPDDVPAALSEDEDSEEGAADPELPEEPSAERLLGNSGSGPLAAPVRPDVHL